MRKCPSCGSDDYVVYDKFQNAYLCTKCDLGFTKEMSASVAAAKGAA